MVDPWVAIARVTECIMSQWYWDGMHTDYLNFVDHAPSVLLFHEGRGMESSLYILFQYIKAIPNTVTGHNGFASHRTRQQTCCCLFTKWPMVFPVPDQKTSRIVEMLTKEVIPFSGVPEAVFTVIGTNLLSHLMLDICSKLGITKMTTTAYHPECNGMVERFNRILKLMLRKHTDKFRTQWDKLLWAYRNRPIRVLARSHHFCYLVGTFRECTVTT